MPAPLTANLERLLMRKHFFNKKVSIAGRKIGDGERVFVIAEAGVAHFGSMKKAFELVDMAVEAGADAVKFQVFKTERLVSSIAPDWIKRLKPKELPYGSFRKIKSYCDRKGILFLATAHEEESADFIEALGVPAVKIGSGEVKNLPFIRHIAKKRKPLIISTGLHFLEDIQDILDKCRKEGNKQIVLMHCITAYPAPLSEVNLSAIRTMKEMFNVPVGYSDHTVGVTIPLSAVAIGASVIEKHICLDKKTKGSQDCRVACDRKDLSGFIRAVREIEIAIGDGKKVIPASSKKSMSWARKSIVAVRRLSAGHKVSQQDIAFKRPGTGIAPDDAGKIIGRRLKRDVGKDDLILWKHL